MTEIVLFVCDDNSILSPMAEAFLRRHCRSAYKVYSAGIEPKPIHLITLQVMEEIGYDIYDTHAKSIFDLNNLQRVDYLITLTDSVNDNFVFIDENIGSRLHWPFRNPWFAPGQAGHFIPAQFMGRPSNLLGSSLLEKPENSQATRTQNKRLIDLSFQTPMEKMQPNNMPEIRIQFRRVRDEMEVQIMNWLEDMGNGPLWWRGA